MTSIARTIDGLEGAILIDANGAVVLSSGSGGGGGAPTSVWSASDAAANGMTLSNGGLTVTPKTDGWQSIRGTISHNSGKFYVEFYANAWSIGSQQGFGLASSSFIPTSYLSSSSYSLASFSMPNAANAGNPSANFVSFYNATGVQPTTNDVWAIAVDLDAGKYWLALNNVWFGSGNPATGANPMVTMTAPALGQGFFPAQSFENSNGAGSWTLQSTAASQKYAPPSGFSAWDSAAPTTPPPVTLNPQDLNNVTLSNGNLTVTQNGSALGNVRSTTSRTTGKWHVEFNNVQGIALNSGAAFGISDVAFALTDGLGLTNDGYGWVQYSGTPEVVGYIGGSPTSGNTFIPGSNGDNFALEIDLDARTIWLFNLTNNIGSTGPYSLSPLPSAPCFITAGFWGTNSTNGSMTVNFGATPFAMTPRAGFAPWNSTHSPQALAYLARTVGGDEGGNGANIATLIDGLVSDGVWAKLDALYVLAQQNATDAQLNLVGTSYTLTGSGNTFVAYQGFSKFQNNGLDTGFSALSPSPHFVRDNASLGAWAYEPVADNETQIGTAFVQGSSYIVAALNGSFYAGVQTNSVDAQGPPPGTTGWFSGDRSVSTTVVSYWNGVQQVSNSSAPSSGGDDNSFRVGGTGSGVRIATKTLSAAFIGASLGAAGQLALYNRLRTYMTAIGVP